MKVGKYQIGRFHAIIRKEYADGSVDYWQDCRDVQKKYVTISTVLENVLAFHFSDVIIRL